MIPSRCRGYKPVGRAVTRYWLRVAFQSTNQNTTMDELVNKLMANAAISQEQAVKALETIKDFVKEKFPMLGGAVDNLFGASDSPDEDGL